MAAMGSSVTAASERQTPHVLVVPFPAQGHMIPLLDLANDLACRGLAVTVLVTPKNLPLVTPTISRLRPAGAGPISTLVLPFPPHPSIPAGVENVKELRPGYFFPMIHAFGGLRDPIYQWALQGKCALTAAVEKDATSDAAMKPQIDAIISDFFTGWTSHLAADLGVPRIVFSPSGANTLAIMHWTWRNIPKRPPSSENDPDYPVCFSGVPNSPTHPWYHTSPIYRRYLEEEGEPDAEFVREGFVANMASWGYVYNSFNDLEAPYLGYIKADVGHPRVWAVGPLGADVAADAKEAVDRGGKSSVDAGKVLRWLDECPRGSVVYVCFGSQVVLRPTQIEAIAAALERSGARFVWVVKQEHKQQCSEGDPDVLEEFERRTAATGLVIRGWAPQVAILSHPAVGWFLSHCGWNSLLEAVIAGVAVLAWPMTADQYFNTRLLVDELGVAVRACEGSDAVPEADALAQLFTDAASAAVAATQNGFGGAAVAAYKGIRKKALQLSEVARESVRRGGSSDRDLDGLVKELWKLKAQLGDGADLLQCKLFI